MNRECASAQALISAAADGELTLQEQQELQAHLALCPECRAAYDQTMAIRDAFAQWAEEEVELPGDLTAAVMQKIRQESPKKPRRRPYFSLALAAACCALMVLGYQLIPRSGNVADSIAPAGEKSLPQEAQSDALQEESKTDAGDLSPQVNTAVAPSGQDSPDDVALMEGVITYFHTSPDGRTAPETQEEGATASVPTLSSSDAALLDWMNQNCPETGYTSYREETGTAATAWLITEAQYAELTAWLDGQSAAYTMEWEDVRVSADAQVQEGMICVIYLPAD